MKTSFTSLLLSMLVSVGLYAQTGNEPRRYELMQQGNTFSQTNLSQFPFLEEIESTDKYANGSPYRIVGYESKYYNQSQHRFFRSDSLAYEWYGNEGSSDPWYGYYGNYYMDKVKHFWDFQVSGDQYIADLFTVKTFNNNGRILRLEQYKTINPGEYTLNAAVNYVYDNMNGRLIRQDVLLGTTLDSNYRYIFTYTLQGRISNLTIQQYIGGWINAQKIDYEYTGPLVGRETISSWNNGTTSWDSSYRSTYTYTNFNEYNYTLYESFNGTIFEPNDSTKYYYNNNNLADSIRYYDWNIGLMDWEEDYLEYFFYDPVYHKKTGYEAYWYSGGWQKDDKEIYQYNVNNHQVFMLDYNVSGGNWVESYRELYTVGALGEPLQMRDENYSGGNWDTSYLYTWNWQYDVVGVENHELPEVSVFPNPFSEQVVFKYTALDAGDFTINIYDLNGRLVFSRQTYEIEGTNAFVWDGKDAGGNILQPGVYVYQMGSNGKFTSGKVIKQ